MWSSKTGLFGPEDMAFLETASSESLRTLLLQDDPIVAMRSLAELSLNGDRKRLSALLNDDVVATHWKQWQQDGEVMPSDTFWAASLE